MDDEVRKKLISLAQLDKDAVAAYNDALRDVHDDEVRENFADFRDEHEHHATVISTAIERLGLKMPQLKVDTVGHFAEWVVSFQSALGEKGPLHAMRTAETYHNARYKAAIDWQIDDQDLAASIRAFYAEEQHHLAFMEERLRVRA